jgi:hypothetical protein
LLGNGSRARGPYLIAAAVFAAAAVAYLWPALFGSKVVFPGTDNPVQSDVVQDFVPWLQYARDAIRSGDFPTWNPYVLSGAPFLANHQTAVTAPVNIPIWLLPFGRGLALSYALKLWLGAMGAFALTRALGVRRTVPGLVAGLSYGFLPYTIVWMQAPISNVWTLLPWMLWAGERIVRDGRGRDAAWLGLASAAAFAGGHSESALHVAGVTGLYAVIRLLQADADGRERLRRLGLVALGGFAGALLAAAVLLPVLRGLSDSAYVAARAPRGTYHLPLGTVRTLLFPDWWGRPTTADLPGGPFNYNERTMYAGAVASVLAGIGVLTTPWRRSLVWIVLAVIGLSAAVGLPPVYQVLAHLPPFDQMANTRLIWVLGLAVAVLAAFGTDRLLAAERPGGRAIGVAAAAVAVGFVVFVTLTPSFEDLKLVWNNLRTGTVWPQVVRLVSVVWFLAVAIGVLAAVLARRYVGATAAVVVLLGVLVLDLAYFSHNYNPMVESSFGEFPRVAEHDRALYPTLAPDAQMRTGRRDPRGHDPPFPRHRYLHLWQRAVPDQIGSAPIAIPGPGNPQARRLLQLLSVREYVNADGSTVEDPQARPRAFVPESVARAATETAALDAMFAPSFVPATDAVVEGAAPAGTTGTVEFVRDDPEHVELRAELDGSGMVVLNDQLDDGWSVEVDGREAEPLRVDSVMRGVAVPAGTHTVTWSYRAPGLRAGLALSVVGLLLILALALWRRTRRNLA